MGGWLWNWLTETFGALAGAREHERGWQYAADVAAGRATPSPPSPAPMGGGQFGPTSAPVSPTGVVSEVAPGGVDPESWRAFVRAHKADLRFGDPGARGPR